MIRVWLIAVLLAARFAASQSFAVNYSDARERLIREYIDYGVYRYQGMSDGRAEFVSRNVLTEMDLLDISGKQSGTRINPYDMLATFIDQEGILAGTENFELSLMSLLRDFCFESSGVTEEINHHNDYHKTIARNLAWCILERVPSNHFFGLVGKFYGLQSLSVDELRLMIQYASKEKLGKEILSTLWSHYPYPSLLAEYWNSFLTPSKNLDLTVIFEEPLTAYFNEIKPDWTRFSFDLVKFVKHSINDSEIQKIPDYSQLYYFSEMIIEHGSLENCLYDMNLPVEDIVKLYIFFSKAGAAIDVERLLFNAFRKKSKEDFVELKLQLLDESTIEDINQEFNQEKRDLSEHVQWLFLLFWHGVLSYELSKPCTLIFKAKLVERFEDIIGITKFEETPFESFVSACRAYYYYGFDNMLDHSDRYLIYPLIKHNPIYSSKVILTRALQSHHLGLMKIYERAEFPEFEDTDEDVVAYLNGRVCFISALPSDMDWYQICHATFWHVSGENANSNPFVKYCMAKQQPLKYSSVDSQLIYELKLVGETRLLTEIILRSPRSNEKYWVIFDKLFRRLRKLPPKEIQETSENGESYIQEIESKIINSPSEWLFGISNFVELASKHSYLITSRAKDEITEILHDSLSHTEKILFLYHTSRLDLRGGRFSHDILAWWNMDLFVYLEKELPSDFHDYCVNNFHDGVTQRFYCSLRGIEISNPILLKSLNFGWIKDKILMEFFRNIPPSHFNYLCKLVPVLYESMMRLSEQSEYKSVVPILASLGVRQANANVPLIPLDKRLLIESSIGIFASYLNRHIHNSRMNRVERRHSWEMLCLELKELALLHISPGLENLKICSEFFHLKARGKWKSVSDWIGTILSRQTTLPLLDFENSLDLRTIASQVYSQALLNVDDWAAEEKLIGANNLNFWKQTGPSVQECRSILAFDSEKDAAVKFFCAAFVKFDKRVDLIAEDSRVPRHLIQWYISAMKIPKFKILVLSGCLRVDDLSCNLSEESLSHHKYCLHKTGFERYLCIVFHGLDLQNSDNVELWTVLSLENVPKALEELDKRNDHRHHTINNLIQAAITKEMWEFAEIFQQHIDEEHQEFSLKLSQRNIFSTNCSEIDNEDFLFSFAMKCLGENRLEVWKDLVKRCGNFNNAVAAKLCHHENEITWVHSPDALKEIMEGYSADYRCSPGLLNFAIQSKSLSLLDWMLSNLFFGGQTLLSNHQALMHEILEQNHFEVIRNICKIVGKFPFSGKQREFFEIALKNGLISVAIIGNQCGIKYNMTDVVSKLECPKMLRLVNEGVIAVNRDLDLMNLILQEQTRLFLYFIRRGQCDADEKILRYVGTEAIAVRRFVKRMNIKNVNTEFDAVRYFLHPPRNNIDHALGILQRLSVDEGIPRIVCEAGLADLPENEKWRHHKQTVLGLLLDAGCFPTIDRISSFHDASDGVLRQMGVYGGMTADFVGNNEINGDVKAVLLRTAPESLLVNFWDFLKYFPREQQQLESAITVRTGGLYNNSLSLLPTVQKDALYVFVWLVENSRALTVVELMESVAPAAIKWKEDARIKRIVQESSKLTFEINKAIKQKNLGLANRLMAIGVKPNDQTRILVNDRNSPLPKPKFLHRIRDRFQSFWSDLKSWFKFKRRLKTKPQ